MKYVQESLKNRCFFFFLELDSDLMPVDVLMCD